MVTRLEAEAEMGCSCLVVVFLPRSLCFLLTVFFFSIFFPFTIHLFCLNDFLYVFILCGHNFYFILYLLCLKVAGLLPNFSLYFVTHLKILFKVTFVPLSFFLLLIRKWSDPWLTSRDTIRTVSFATHWSPNYNECNLYQISGPLYQCHLVENSFSSKTRTAPSKCYNSQ